MSYFFDPADSSRITELRVADGDIALVGLWRQDPGGPTLNVSTWDNFRSYTDGDVAVRLLRNNSIDEFIYEIYGSKLKSSTLRACLPEPLLGTIDPARHSNTSFNIRPPVAEIRINHMVNASGKPDIRKHIVDLARSFVRRGHYLWGTAGNRPGLSDGNFAHAASCEIRAVCLDATATSPPPVKGSPADPVLGINQAFQTRFETYNSCAGRCDRDGIAFTPSKGELDTYLKERREALDRGEKDQRRWPGLGPRNNLYPRRYWFRGSGSGVVWGEACQDVPHFDCIGLVNYCYSRFWKTGAFEVEIEKMPDQTMDVSKSPDLMDADIVIRPGHIAMIYKAGDGSFKVVQAAETIKGLTDDSSYNPSEWTSRHRMDAIRFQDSKDFT